MVDQVRTLAFAGQDTTATVSASCLYELSRHPEVLTTLRAEMDGVFGPEIGQEGHQIRDDPSILARCFYLNAVIKEGLRIWVPTASARDAEQDYMFSHNNRLYRKGSGYFHISSTAMHMHPDHFHSPDKFDPSRWFDAEGHPITMPITFMPFSKGELRYFKSPMSRANTSALRKRPKRMSWYRIGLAGAALHAGDARALIRLFVS